MNERDRTFRRLGTYETLALVCGIIAVAETLVFSGVIEEHAVGELSLAFIWSCFVADFIVAVVLRRRVKAYDS